MAFGKHRFTPQVYGSQGGRAIGITSHAGTFQSQASCELYDQEQKKNGYYSCKIRRMSFYKNQ